MPSNGMLSCVAFGKCDVSDEDIASVITVTRIRKLRKTIAVTSNQSTLQRRTTHRNIADDGTFHSYRRESLKSYIFKYIISIYEHCAVFLCSIMKLNLLNRNHTPWR
jgi:uncharacterized protein YbcV (DUF1398 family)